MERTRKIPPADFILTGDWHLREDTPVCRTDDFQKALWNKVDFISDLQKQHNCPVLHSGDLFNHWKPSPWLLSKAIQHLPKEFYTIYGNHDLPQHQIELQDKCGIYALEQAGKLKVLPCMGHWNSTPDYWKNYELNKIKGVPYYVYHVMTFQKNLPWPGCTDTPAAGILKKYPQYDLILTGHNHKAFTQEREGRLLVNPGSITRQNANQMDFHPRVYLYYAETNSVKIVYLPIEKDVVTRIHIDNKEERADRIDAFIEKLDTTGGTTLDYETNIDVFFSKNTVRDSVKDIVYECLEA